MCVRFSFKMFFGMLYIRRALNARPPSDTRSGSIISLANAFVRHGWPLNELTSQSSSYILWKSTPSPNGLVAWPAKLSHLTSMRPNLAWQTACAALHSVCIIHYSIGSMLQHVWNMKHSMTPKNSQRVSAFHTLSVWAVLYILFQRLWFSNPFLPPLEEWCPVPKAKFLLQPLLN